MQGIIDSALKQYALSLTNDSRGLNMRANLFLMKSFTITAMWLAVALAKRKGGEVLDTYDGSTPPNFTWLEGARDVDRKDGKEVG